MRSTATVLAFAAVLAAAVAPAEGQPSIFGTPQQQAPSIFGGTPEPPRPSLPPPDSSTLLRNIELRFPRQGGVPGVDLNTYLYYMEVAKQVSLPSQQRWTPYTDETAEVILDDFQRLWDTGFLNDLWVEVVDDPYPNGVAAKRVIFNLDERERVKIVTYEGSEVLSTEDILDNLEQQGITLRMDSFIDPETIRRVKAVIRRGHQAQGHMFAEVDHTIEALPGGPKLVRLTFNMTEGPKVQVHEIDFIGNEAMSDRRLRGRMKKIKQRWWLSWMTGRGTYKPEEYEEDAVGIEASYRDQGYITAQVGQPELDYLELSEDGETRGLPAADSGRRGRAVPYRRGQLRRQRDPSGGRSAQDLRGHRAGELLQRRRRAKGLRRRPRAVRLARLLRDDARARAQPAVRGAGSGDGRGGARGRRERERERLRQRKRKRGRGRGRERKRKRGRERRGPCASSRRARPASAAIPWSTSPSACRKASSTSSTGSSSPATRPRTTR